MNTHPLSLGPARLEALPSGALLWPGRRLLVVSDLHIGKAERMARRGAGLMPPYDTEETLDRLSRDLDAHVPDRVICLGDSFDDLTSAAGLPERHRLTLAAMMAGRDWIWVEGNHDPGPLDVGGRHLSAVHDSGLTFRHIADPDADGPEVSGHWHPKAALGDRGRRVRRPCFLTDGTRLILPAYGAYTGGMAAEEAAALAGLRLPATAILAGPTMVRLPVAPAHA